MSDFEWSCAIMRVDSVAARRTEHNNFEKPGSGKGEESMSEWRPIQTAPKDGTRILLYPVTSGMRHTGDRFTTGGYWHQPANPSAKGFWVCNFKTERPTHWMPQPEPPVKA